MIQARHDLGKSRTLRTGAVGVPGKRAFKLEVDAERGSAVVWLEKEQLSALALTVKRLLEEVPENPARTPAGEPSSSVREPFFDFKIVNLALAHDEAAGMFAILAYDARDAESDRATIIWWSSRRQVQQLADEALEVVAAGRPICMLCKQPMDASGHMCPRTNGFKAGIEEL